MSETCSGIKNTQCEFAVEVLNPVKEKRGMVTERFAQSSGSCKMFSLEPSNFCAKYPQKNKLLEDLLTLELTT